ncbi:mucin-1-like [Sorex araneus]|uniref:mucin-1-like n=1 Tax=Sorex araneus TaxID=42254 RepID=UPI002433505E|nr:mucin-1-like [Sorex araneus]
MGGPAGRRAPTAGQAARRQPASAGHKCPGTPGWGGPSSPRGPAHDPATPRSRSLRPSDIPSDTRAARPASASPPPTPHAAPGPSRSATPARDGGDTASTRPSGLGAPLPPELGARRAGGQAPALGPEAQRGGRRAAASLRVRRPPRAEPRLLPFPAPLESPTDAGAAAPPRSSADPDQSLRVHPASDPDPAGRAEPRSPPRPCLRVSLDCQTPGNKAVKKREGRTGARENE